MKVFRAEAPGRVNLIGEHTDYNGGFVLPTPIPQTTRVVTTLREDRLVRVTSSLYEGAEARSDYELGGERSGRGWLDYVQGVTSLLASAGHALGGFDLHIDSSVPVGSGLSSSAALEVALLRAIRAAFGLTIDDVAIAKLGQRVENEFVGARVGIMDQMASSVGRPGHALFIDCRDLNYRHVPIPLDRLDLVVIHSGVSHSNAGGEYNQRRAQCEEACRILGVGSLRDLDESDLSRIGVSLAHLPDTLLRRARHVITENARVLAAVAALEKGDAESLGKLFYASQRSMRDDYEISAPEIDLLVRLASKDPAVFGARMTGGGFGGSIVVITRPGTGPGVSKRILDAYVSSTGLKGLALVA